MGWLKRMLSSGVNLIQGGTSGVLKTSVKSGANAVQAVSGGTALAVKQARSVAKSVGNTPKIFGNVMKGLFASGVGVGVVGAGAKVADYARGVFTKTDSQIQYEQAVKTADDEADVLAKLKESYGAYTSLLFDGGTSSGNPFPINRSVSQAQDNEVETASLETEKSKWIIGGLLGLAGLSVGTYVYSKIKKSKEL